MIPGCTLAGISEARGQMVSLGPLRWVVGVPSGNLTVESNGHPYGHDLKAHHHTEAFQSINQLQERFNSVLPLLIHNNRTVTKTSRKAGVKDLVWISTIVLEEHSVERTHGNKFHTATESK